MQLHCALVMSFAVSLLMLEHLQRWGSPSHFPEVQVGGLASGKHLSTHRAHLSSQETLLEFWFEANFCGDALDRERDGVTVNFI